MYRYNERSGKGERSRDRCIDIMKEEAKEREIKSIDEEEY